MSGQPIKDMRVLLSALLPKAIERAVQSYQTFATQTPPDNAKEFSAHHSACKAALSHLDHLTKLAKWVEEQHKKLNSTDKTSLEPLIIAARATLLEYDKPKKDYSNETD